MSYLRDLRYNPINMLRNVLMSLGFIVAILPYVGLPYDVTKWIWSAIGLVIVFLLFFSRKGRLHYIPYELDEEERATSTELRVTRHDEVDRPVVHIERETLLEALAGPDEPADVVTIEETKITSIKKRKRKGGESLPPNPEKEEAAP